MSYGRRHTGSGVGVCWVWELYELDCLSLLLSIIMGQSPIFTSHAMFSWWVLHAFYLDAYLLLRSLCLKRILPSACAALSSRGVKLKWRDWLLRLTQIRIDTSLSSFSGLSLPAKSGWIGCRGPTKPSPLGAWGGNLNGVSTFLSTQGRKCA